MSYRDQVNLWRKKVAEKWPTPFYASVSTLVKCSEVDHSRYDHWMSMCFERGTRVYVFTSQANRDRFVGDYRAFGAKPCKDPLS